MTHQYPGLSEPAPRPLRGWVLDRTPFFRPSARGAGMLAFVAAQSSAVLLGLVFCAVGTGAAGLGAVVAALTGATLTLLALSIWVIMDDRF